MSERIKIVAKSNRQIQNPVIYRGIQAQDLKIQIARRKVPLEIHKALFNFRGDIVWEDGTPFHKPVCIFTEFDLENRWYSLYRKVDESGNPLHRSEQFSRIRLLDIWHQIRDLEGLD